MSSSPSSSSVRELLHERLDALLADCDHVMDTAAFGQVFHHLDDFLLTAGKKFTQEVLQQKLQERIKHGEQKSENKQCPHCKKKRTSKTKNRKR